MKGGLFGGSGFCSDICAGCRSLRGRFGRAATAASAAPRAPMVTANASEGEEALAAG